MNAPKKIWMVEETCWSDHEQPCGEIPYIRADLVDGLVEALELLVSYGNVFSHKAGLESPYKIAQDALKELREP